MESVSKLANCARDALRSAGFSDTRAGFFFFFSLIIHGRRVTSGFTVKEDVQFGEAITRGELAGVSVAAAHKLSLSMTLCSSCQVLKLLLLLLSEPAVLLELDCVVIQQTSRVGLT